MSAHRLLAGAALAVVTFIAASAQATTYIVDDTAGAGGVTGSITTDGVIGPIASSDITDWNLLLNNGSDTFDLTGPLSGDNSSVSLADIPSQFTATASGLFWNFGINSSILTFEGTSSSNSDDFLQVAGGGGCPVSPASICVTVNGNTVGTAYTSLVQIAGVAATPTPTPLQLAKLSNATNQSGTPTIPGFSYLTDNQSLHITDNSGFHAIADISADGTQIVVAFRGTVLKDGATTVKDFLADGSYITGKPSLNLTALVSDAANFTEQLESKYSNATITFTGHSLGGGIAELIAEKTGFQAIVFDAPSGATLYPQLSVQLSVLDSTTTPPAAQISDYRLTGDQVSLAGAEFPNTTLFSVASPSSIQTSGSQTETLVAAFRTIGQYHDLGLLIDQLGNGSPISTNNVGLNLFSGNLDLSNVLVPIADLFNYAEDARFAYLYDPSAGSQFILQNSPTSPFFNTLELPSLAGVGQYDVRYEIGSTWLPFALVMPGDVLTLPAGVDGFEFDPLNALGEGMQTTGSFLFAATFASSGTVSTEIQEIGVLPSSVPEPAAWILLVLGFGGVGALVRRRRASGEEPVAAA